jgi:hypothetical protein
MAEEGRCAVMNIEDILKRQHDQDMATYRFVGGVQQIVKNFKSAAYDEHYLVNRLCELAEAYEAELRRLNETHD